jgi:phosphoesterase RecJ-like protein
MPIDWAPFVELVRRHRRLLLTTHVRPDGDGLGSMLALADVLEHQGKSVQMTVASVFPPRYQFLDPEHRITRFALPGDAWREAEAVVVLDTGTWNQLGDFATFLKASSVPRLVIDHHQTQDNLGGIALIDITAEATGRLAYEAITALGAPLTPRAAQGLFIALAMDTGWFRHSNTKPATFALAARLEEAGANPTEAYDFLFEQNTLSRLRLMGLILERLQVVHNGLIAYTEVRRADYATTGAAPQETEDLVNYTRSVIGVEVGLFFLEQPRGGVKVSLRSRSRVDVARVAEQFGGGGHRLAAGAVLETTLDDARARVLDAVIKALPAT